MKKLRITVEGKAYEVLVETLDAPAAGTSSSAPLPMAPVVVTPPAPAPKPVAHAPGVIASPLSGKVVTVQVQQGDSVTAGQCVVTIEAMKMNTYVNAMGSGKVARIHVNAGDTVEEGQALITIE